MKKLPNIQTIRQLYELVEEVGFLPLFSGEMPGFSLMDITKASAWWSDDPERDPWQWRQQVAEEGKIAYGKVFCKKAGFISREWFPVFANYRRQGYDYDSLYEEGKATYKSKRIMELFEKNALLPSYEIKKFAGFGQDGLKGFEGAITSLQMQTYLAIRGFECKSNKIGEKYGWPVALYSTAENLFGYEYVRSAYLVDPGVSKEKIFERCAMYNPEAFDEDIYKFIKN